MRDASIGIADAKLSLQLPEQLLSFLGFPVADSVSYRHRYNIWQQLGEIKR